MGGYCAALRLSQKVRFLEGYLEFIKTCQNEIRYTGNYLSDIVKNHSKEGIFYSYLDKCYGYISNADSFPCAWKKSFFNITRELSVSTELTEIIINFGLGLGTNDIDGQMSHCQYNYDLAYPYLQTARDEKKSKGKLYGILGVCISTATALFLI